MDEEIVDAGYDIPSIFDYDSQEIGGSINELPSKVQLNITSSRNQFADKRTKMACWKYSLQHCINEEDRKEINPMDFRFKFNGTSWTVGSSIKDNLADAISDWMIAWYWVCKNLEAVKEALARWNCIATGTNSCDRWKVKNDFMFHYIKNGAGHLICIEWYDDEKQVLIIRDSMGQDSVKRDKGRFYIKYDDFKYLFSCYEIYPLKNKDLIAKYKKMNDQELIKKTVELWLMNWKDLDKNLTREQMAIIIARLFILVEGLLASNK